MKKIILLIIIILELIIIKIPTYVELNNLAIIKEIGIEYKNNKYTLILKEIIPIKDNQGIKYEYKTYKATSSNLDSAYIQITKKTKKKLYLKKTQSLITNINHTNTITDILRINPSTIIHTNNVKEKINN